MDGSPAPETEMFDMVHQSLRTVLGEARVVFVIVFPSKRTEYDELVHDSHFGVVDVALGDVIIQDAP